jgi:hypothetical protein
LRHGLSEEKEKVEVEIGTHAPKQPGLKRGGPQDLRRLSGIDLIVAYGKNSEDNGEKKRKGHHDLDDECEASTSQAHTLGQMGRDGSHRGDPATNTCAA